MNTARKSQYLSWVGCVQKIHNVKLFVSWNIPPPCYNIMQESFTTVCACLTFAMHSLMRAMHAFVVRPGTRSAIC